MICKKHQPKECEDCIREEIKKLENKISELKAKLPQPQWTQGNGIGGIYYNGTTPLENNIVLCGMEMKLDDKGNFGIMS